jgi:hypothetical protein
MGFRLLALAIWIFVLIVLASGLSFCAGQLGSPVPRPWDYNAWNEHRFSFLLSEIINPDYTDDTLFGLASEKIDRSGMDAAATSLANSYEDSLGAAIEQRAECGAFFSFDNNNNVNLDTIPMGTLRQKFLDGGEDAAHFLYNNPDCAGILGLKGIKSTHQDGNDTITSYEIGEESAATLIILPSQMHSLVKIIDYTGMNGYSGGNTSSMNDLLGTAVQNGYLSEAARDMLVGISLLKSRQACIDYSDSYVKTIDYALKLYENSSSSAYKNMSRIKSFYASMEYMGFCSRSYTGIGSQLCRQLEAEVSSNATTYYSMASDNDAALRDSMGKMPTNLTYAVEGTNMMWDFISSNSGLEAEYAQKNLSFARALEDARSNADSSSNLLIQTTSDLDKQNLGNITEIYIPEGPLSSSVGNIAASFAQYDEQSSQASAELERLNVLEKDKPYGWAADAYDGYVSLNSRISEAIVSAKETLYYAQGTVNYTRSQAVSIADGKRAEGYNVSYIYQKIAAGDNKETLGERFTEYKEAYLAALALARPESTQNETEALARLKAEVQSMLDNAKKDNIDVSSEQAEFDMYKNSANMRLAIEHMNNIEQEIIGKAEAAYSDLPATRARLIRYFEADRNGVLDSIRARVEGEESGLIAGSSIDFGAALGRLKTLRAAYSSAEKDIEAMLAQYLESSIVPEVEYAPPVADLNGMSSLSGTIKIENPLQQRIDEIVISFQPPLTIEPGEISGISAAKSGKTLTFTVRSLQPMEIRTYEFRKQGIFAQGTLASAETNGIDGTAYTTESWLVSISVPLDGLDMGEYESVAFNGAKYPGGAVTRPIPEGTYEATAEKSKSGAYAVSENQTTESTPQSTIIHRAVHISPNVYLDTVTLRKESVCTVESSTYQYSQTASQAVLQKVRGTGDVLMDCVYPRDVARDTIGNLTDALGDMNLTESERQKLDNITVLLSMGQNSTALSELLSLNRTISARLDAERKANATLSKQLSLLDMEAASLNESIALAGSLNHSSYLVDLYGTRLASLSSLRSRANAAGAAEAAALLSGYNPQWSETETSKWLSQAFTNFTKTEKSYNDNGMDDPSVSAAMSSFRQSYVKAKSAEGNLTQAVYASYYLDIVSNAVLSALADRDNGLARLNASLESALSALESNLTAYEAIYNDAKQHKAESYLPYAPSHFSSEIAKMRKAATERQMRSYLNQSASLAALMSDGINNIAKVAENEISTASMLLGQSRADLDSASVSRAESSLKGAEDALGLQKYGSAISMAKGISADIAAFIKQKGENETRLLAIGLLIIGSLAVIAYSYREPIMGLFGTRRGKIALRKLKKGSDEGQE